MRLDRSFGIRDLLAHRHRDVPRSGAVVAHAAGLLAHETVSAGIDNLFQLRRDRIEAVKNALRHEPARLRRKALEAIILVRRTFGLEARLVLHRIDGAVAVAGAAEDASAAPLFALAGVKPALHAREAGD